MLCLCVPNVVYLFKHDFAQMLQSFFYLYRFYSVIFDFLNPNHCLGDIFMDIKIMKEKCIHLCTSEVVEFKFSVRSKMFY